MKIVVIGGTGLIGSKVVAKLKQKGREAIAAAPNTGVNTITGEGLKEALAGAQASGVGWYSSTVGLLQLVASIVGGLLWDQVGHTAVFFYGATFAVLGSIAMVLVIPASMSARVVGGGAGVR